MLVAIEKIFTKHKKLSDSPVSEFDDCKIKTGLSFSLHPPTEGRLTSSHLLKSWWKGRMQTSCPEPINLGPKHPGAGRVAVILLRGLASGQACLGKLQDTFRHHRIPWERQPEAEWSFFVILDMWFCEVNADLNANAHLGFVAVKL